MPDRGAAPPALPPRAAGPPAQLWTQKEAAAFLHVSARYLRESGCPKILLPGTGTRGQPLVRYDPRAVWEWAERWNTKHAMKRSA